jgi:hypothetical protein
MRAARRQSRVAGRSSKAHVPVRDTRGARSVANVA